MAFPNLNVAAVWAAVLSLVGMPGGVFCYAWRRNDAVDWQRRRFLFVDALARPSKSASRLSICAAGITPARLPATGVGWFIIAISAFYLSAYCSRRARCCSAMLCWVRIFLRRLTARRAGSSWQKLFWFFAQAEIYVAILPCFRIRHPLAGGFHAASGLERAGGGAGAVWRGDFWFLHSGLPHVRSLNDLMLYVLLIAGGFAGIAGQHFAGELVCAPCGTRACSSILPCYSCWVLFLCSCPAVFRD